MNSLILFVLSQLNAVHRNGAVLVIAVDAFHAVIADFVWIKITTVTFAAANAFPVIQFAHFLHENNNSLQNKIIAQSVGVRNHSCKMERRRTPV